MSVTITTYEELKRYYAFDEETDAIGEGGFGKVFVATDTLRTRNVAVKASEVKGEGISYTLMEEAKLVKEQIPPHPNIAYYKACYRIKVAHSRFDYAIMDYYALGNLKQLFTQTALSDAEKLSIATQILQGVMHLHNNCGKNGIIHRDLKPQNILMAEATIKGEHTYIPKITDFGISKALKAQSGNDTDNSFVGGSLYYASPEQLGGAETIGKNTDLWSWGVLTYQLYTGELPFKLSHEGSDDTRQARFYQLLLTKPTPPLLHLIPQPVQKAVQQALTFERNKRPQKAEELLSIIAPPLFAEAEMDTIINPINTNHNEEDKTEELATIIEKPQKRKTQPKTTAKPKQPKAEPQPDETESTFAYWAAMIGVMAVLFGVGIGVSMLWDTAKEWLLPPSPKITPGINVGVLGKPFIRMVPIPGKNLRMSETEITIGQYLAFCKATNANYPEWLKEGSIYHIHTGSNPFYKQVGMAETNTTLPITGITALDAEAFCKWMGGRLPTQDEWQFAAQGGELYQYAGSNNLNEVAWYESNSGGQVQPVKQKKPNAYGLYDMTGNVWEWTSSLLALHKVMCGGSWSSQPNRCLISFTDNGAANYAYHNIGFRMVAEAGSGE